MANPRAKPGLLELGKTLLAKGPVKTLETPRRIRILLGGRYVADTTAALYVWEHPFYPYYYVPKSAFPSGCLELNSGADEVQIARLTSGDRASTNRVLVFADELGGAKKSKVLAGMVRVEFGEVDAWFEEEERIYVHPKDPFRRVDILPSARPVRVLVGGVEVAASGSVMHLYETGLPVRFYLPVTAVDPSFLRESSTTTECPYKGIANYYHVVVNGKEFKDLVWYYRTPTHESAAVAGLLCFYNEKVDIELDGKMLERPKTVFA